MDIQGILKRLDNKKTSGQDGISNKQQEYSGNFFWIDPAKAYQKINFTAKEHSNIIKQLKISVNKKSSINKKIQYQ